MRPVTFDEMARMPLLHHYEEAFRKATGVSLKLVAAEEPKQCVNFGKGQNTFCAHMDRLPAGCTACLETQAHIERITAKKLVTQQLSCFAGLTEIATPVMVDGRHVATLMSGQVFRREPTLHSFKTMLKKLKGGAGREWKKKALRAYFDTPVIRKEKLEAIIHMITVFAVHLSDDAIRHSIACSEIEPHAVRSAKEFIQSHSEESITLEQVLQHVHVSRFHFCKVFKKTTGITLTEYVARVRVIKAKILLADLSLRISDVVFASGFGSVPQFNSVFKRSVGMSPTVYRAMLHARAPLESFAGLNKTLPAGNL